MLIYKNVMYLNSLSEFALYLLYPKSQYLYS